MVNNRYEKINSNDEHAEIKIGEFIIKNINCIKNSKQIVILCIGSNNIDGEFLAPLVERFLKENKKPLTSTRVILTSDRKNVIKNIIRIKSRYNDPFIIVIASEVGNSKDVGKIILKKDPVPSQLLQNIRVGNIAISAIVNDEDYDNDCDFYVQMQTAKLVLVYKIAKVISKGLEFGLN
ncbi:DUF1256 domain-containing protein [Clostridium hydrogenum]|uniref:DUF1256 domain-containing protein n=1 Tax=Clostridium hydrogenum TaxID=2855764 RepID=UPI001F3F7A8B|nr:DUF1256 domain-containing protein [Clostridium hydrogenum]